MLFMMNLRKNLYFFIDLYTFIYKYTIIIREYIIRQLSIFVYISGDIGRRAEEQDLDIEIFYLHK